MLFFSYHKVTGDACASSPCIEGTCQVVEQGYECVCPDDRNGLNCQYGRIPSFAMFISNNIYINYWKICLVHPTEISGDLRSIMLNVIYLMFF